MEESILECNSPYSERIASYIHRAKRGKKLTAENFWSSHRNLGVQISANGDYVALLYMTYATVSNYIHVIDAYSCRVFFPLIYYDRRKTEWQIFEIDLNSVS